MNRPWEIIERNHDLQNPTSPEKIRLLGDYLRLTADSRVLDVGCGKCGPALILASTYGCHVVGVEKRVGFAGEARTRIAAQGLESRIEVHTADASQFQLEPGSWDAALCLGASFVWGTIGETAAALARSVRHGGYLAIGEPFWRRWPLPEGVEAQDYVSLDATVARFQESGLVVTGIIGASEDDWDHYESLHWRAIEEWLAEHPEQPEADEIRANHLRYQSDYFRFQRALLGWAIFIGRIA